MVSCNKEGTAQILLEKTILKLSGKVSLLEYVSYNLNYLTHNFDQHNSRFPQKNLENIYKGRFFITCNCHIQRIFPEAGILKLLCEKQLNPFHATHISFYTSWKHQKTSGFLMFSGGIGRDQ